MEVAVVGAVVGAVVSNVVAKLSVVLDKRFSELDELDDDIDYLRTELRIIGCVIEAQQKGQPSDLQHISMAAMGKLAFDIEDCLDQFLPCACGEGEVSRGNVVDFVLQIGKLKKRLQRLNKPKSDDPANGSHHSTDDAEAESTTSEAEDLVGIEKPKQEILGLLQSEKLMVISIVGFGGSGKTELAKAVYACHEVQENFGLRAWAVASKHKDGHGLLISILQVLIPGERLVVPKIPSDQASRLQRYIITHLRAKNTRCLIVIDDIKKHHWEAIKCFFSKLCGCTIRILLTTAVQTVANACIKDGGYIYNMRNLSAEDSKDLLKRKVPSFNGLSTQMADGSAAIVCKCHGHPLALISVANHLEDKKPLTLDVCEDTMRFLCSHMDENKNKNFTKLRQVLTNNYSSLPGYLKACLLYTSLFPNDRPVSRKTLTRRWLAEGYIWSDSGRSDQEAADENFKELMDRNIIHPIDASNCGKAKTCKPHSMMHQFMLYKSISSNFIATTHKNRSNFRHLVIENQTSGTASDMDHGAGPAARRPKLMIKLSRRFRPSSSTGPKEMRPRSLTVYGGADDIVYSGLTKCQLLRVLDLKECNDDLSDEHLQIIYNMLHLKYLALGSSVTKLSAKMKRLHCLETLDLRKTKIDTLPLEIILLPHLAHLLGKIKLNKSKKINLDYILEGKSKMQSLAGVVIDNKSVFPELMDKMKKLTTVKIWCQTTSTNNDYTLLSKAIHKFTKDGTGTGVGNRSLSIHLNDWYKGFLHNTDVTPTKLPGKKEIVKKIVYLSSLKLHGRPSQFDFKFVDSMSGLKELCLVSTKLKPGDLSELRKLQCLVSLKLVDVHLADFIIQCGDFRSLQRLCLVVQEPRFPTFQEEALPSLLWLQLLCENLTVLLSDHIQVNSFGHLEEIALDSKVNEETIECWKIKAGLHPQRPRLLLLKRVDPVKYIEPVMICGCGEICSHTSLMQGTP